MQARNTETRFGGVVVGLVAAAAAASCTTPPVEHADLVLRNGTIVTVGDLIPEAEALAVRRSAEVDRHIGEETQVIELDGRLAIPGFIEGHGHFLGIGDAKLQLDLRGAGSWADIVVMVEDAAARARPGELIRGRGWHQDKWDPPPSPGVEGLPLHDALSAVSPANPVRLRHASGHATLANAKAMELAGITADTPDPPGGEIVRDAAGHAIGAFRETAAGLLSAARRDTTPGDPRRQAELAVRELLENGITSFQDAGASFATVDLYKSMVEDGSLGVRLWVMLRASNPQLAEHMADYRIIGMGDDRLTVRGRSSTRSTARSARMERGCSSPTTTCRIAVG